MGYDDHDIDLENASKDELKGYLKGLRAAKQKAGSTLGAIKQSFIDHSVRYILIGVITFSAFAGSYYFFIKPTVAKAEEKIEAISTSVTNSVDSVKNAKIFHPTKWVSLGLFKKDENNTSEKINEGDSDVNNKVVSVTDTNVSSEDNNKSKKMYKVVFSKIKSIFRKDKNESEE